MQWTMRSSRTRAALVLRNNRSGALFRGSPDKQGKESPAVKDKPNQLYKLPDCGQKSNENPDDADGA